MLLGDATDSVVHWVHVRAADMVVLPAPETEPDSATVSVCDSTVLMKNFAKKFSQSVSY